MYTSAEEETADVGVKESLTIFDSAGCKTNVNECRAGDTPKVCLNHRLSSLSLSSNLNSPETTDAHSVHSILNLSIKKITNLPNSLENK